MRRLAGDAGLPLPEFASDRQKNEFKATLFLHHLLTAEDHAWLKSLTNEALTAEEAKALIYARETGAVDNTACRDFSGLDTLQASNVLRRLRDRGLLEKQGAGNRTYYVLKGRQPEKAALAPDLFADEGGKLDAESGNLAAESGNLANRSLPPLPPDLAAKLPSKGTKTTPESPRQLIADLCQWHELRADELASFLGKDRKYLRNHHLTEMVKTGRLVFLYPESPNHKWQAYKRAEQTHPSARPGTA
jgi:ATP-dependent DNA helicase RecG